MKVKYRQLGPFGCGSFSLANVFDDHRFVENIPKEHGERLPDLQRKMNKYQRSLFIDNIFMTSSYFDKNNRLEPENVELFEVENRQDYKGLCIPLIIGFARVPGRHHSIAVIHEIDKNLFHVADSCEDKVIKMSPEQFIKFYQVVAVSVFKVWSCKDIAATLMMEKEFFAHIF